MSGGGHGGGHGGGDHAPKASGGGGNWTESFGEAKKTLFWVFIIIVVFAAGYVIYDFQKGTTPITMATPEVTITTPEVTITAPISDEAAMTCEEVGGVIVSSMGDACVVPKH